MGTPMDIWEMGLVDEVAVTGGVVRVSLVLTDTSCVFFTGIRRHIIDVLSDIAGVEQVSVEVNAEVLWTPDRIRAPAP
jgi:metal-sulfur cluster biosynthetic enzyme